ncbi:hypothetical protein CES86_1679 [Brucella lupini]|uniref:Uncharacterized protein n=1 Tax=Brucella lupini TaxID=255457 RepID=A0A256GT32_9HYPH|nr:hypothetical protein CES86_1679 [Brucella lupini]
MSLPFTRATTSSGCANAELHAVVIRRARAIRRRLLDELENKIVI